MRTWWEVADVVRGDVEIRNFTLLAPSFKNYSLGASLCNKVLIFSCDVGYGKLDAKKLSFEVSKST